MKKLLLTLSILPLLASAQSELFKRVRQQPGHTTPSVMVLNDHVKISAMEVPSFLREQLALSSDEKLEMVKQFTDRMGMEHLRYRQTINGVPVLGAEYTAHLKDGFATKFTGHVFANVSRESAVLTKEDALQAGLDYMGASVYMWEDAQEEALLKRIRKDENATYLPDPELMYFNATFDLNKPQFALAYEVEIYAKQPMRKEKIYVSAVDGRIIQTINQLHDADQDAHGLSMFSDTVQIVTKDTLGGYALFDYTRGGGVETYNIQQTTNYAMAIPFTHSDTLWDIANANKDEAAIDAHYGAEVTYDYFMQKHGRDSYDGNGTVILSYVHFDVNWQNASWDGARMRYGDGSVQGNPFLSVDIAGHEVGHGVTQFASGLIYAGESGGLNESFSDIFGNAIEQFADSSRANWYVGEQCGNTLRNMADPNEFNDPDTYEGGYWKPTASPSQSNDWGGVHSNSGVQNYWFYLLVEGGAGTNDIGNSFNVAPMGWDAAGEIAYRNLEVYLTPSSNYMDARDFAYESAADIYGDCTPEAENVVEAWYAVGVGQRLDASVTPDFLVNYDYACALPLVLDFTNLTVGATSYFWAFGNGNTSVSESPTQFFYDEGSYTIEMNAFLDNGCYSDTGVVTRTLNVVEAGDPNAANCLPEVFISSSSVGIERVQLRTLDYESGLDDFDYNDYTCQSNTVMHIDSTYSITVTTNPSSRENVRVWIDLNNDGDFTDEELLFSNDDTYTTHTGTISFDGKNVSMKQPLRMRVMSDIYFNKAFDACEGLQNGQTEDYSVIITDDFSDILSSVKEEMTQPLSLYPNPARDQVSVMLPDGEQVMQVRLMDMRGREVQAVRKRVVDISALNAGTYIVEARSLQGVYREKLIVE